MTHSARTKAWLSIAFAAALGGCGSSGGVPEVPFADYQTRLVTAYCKLRVACTDMPDEATCRASIQLPPGYVATLQQDIDSGKTRFDGKRAAHCLSLIEGLSGCKKTQQAAEARAALGDVCPGLFTGTVAVGGACFFHGECASGLCTPTDPACSVTQQCCAGTCVDVPPPVPAGGDCSNLPPNQSCATGSVCNATTASAPLLCTSPVAAEGASCTSIAGCRWPMFCEVAANTVAGTCKRPVATGEACNPQSPQSCDDGADVCVPETMRCAPRTALGAACGSQTCVSWADCRNATCGSRLTPGQGCDPTFGATCLGDASCTRLICTIVPASAACL